MWNKYCRPRCPPKWSREKREQRRSLLLLHSKTQSNRSSAYNCITCCQPADGRMQQHLLDCSYGINKPCLLRKKTCKAYKTPILKYAHKQAHKLKLCLYYDVTLLAICLNKTMCCIKHGVLRYFTSGKILNYKQKSSIRNPT